MKQFQQFKGAYVKIPNELLRDQTISWKAKGLFCWMASHEDTFTFTTKSIAKNYPDGRTSILNAMQELKESGWMTYIKKANGYGKYLLNTTIKPELEILTLDKSTDKSPKSEKQTMDQEPKSENPKLGYRTVRKPNRINKNNSNNKNNIYKGKENNFDEKDQKQKQDHLPELSSAMKLKVSQIANHFSLKGVQNAN